MTLDASGDAILSPSLSHFEKYTVKLLAEAFTVIPLIKISFKNK